MDSWTLIAAISILAGVLGLFLPFLPGTPLLFLGALLLDMGSGWNRFGPFWLGVLALLTIVSIGADWWLSNATARRGGASWLSLLVGLLLGLAGIVFFPPFGMIVGSVVGVVGTELLRQRNAGQAARAGGGWLIGWLASLAVEVGIGLVMLVIIAVGAR